MLLSFSSVRRSTLFYCGYLCSFSILISRRWIASTLRNLWLLHDNAPVHKSKRTQATTAELKLKLVEHAPYRPDLALSDYFLFKDLRNHLRGKSFGTSEEIREHLHQYFGSKLKEYFKGGLDRLKDIWQKCIDLGGDYLD